MPGRHRLRGAHDAVVTAQHRRLLQPAFLWGIAFELVFTAAIVYVPPLQSVFGTAALDVRYVALLAVFPLVVWGSDELRRWRYRIGQSQ
jgi:hypothetical protein